MDGPKSTKFHAMSLLLEGQCYVFDFASPCRSVSCYFYPYLSPFKLSLFEML